MFWTRCLIVMAAVVSLLGVACDGLEEQDAPRIVVSPSELQFDSVAVGSTSTSFVTVSNQGLVDLNISAITLELSTDFVTITSPTSLVVGPGAEEIVTLSFTPTTPANTEGALVFRSNDPLNSELRVPVGSPLLIPVPNIVRQNPDIAPDVLDFGLVAEGTSTTLERVIQNVGEAPLIICNAFVTGSPDLTSDLETALLAARDEQGLVVVAPITSTTGASRALEFNLTYAPPSPGPDEADLVIEYDEQGFLDEACAEDRVQTTRFPVTGEAGSPFLRVNPNPVNFGESPIDVTREQVVTLTNAGELPLDIFNVRLDRDRTPGEFQLVDSSQIPALVPAGESVTILVSYLPRAELGHAGVIQIEHGDGAGGRRTTEVAMAGVGVPDTCPVAIARAYVQEDGLNRTGTEIDWALPLQTLVLDGSQSLDPEGGDLILYEWEITERAQGSVNGLRPFSGDPENEAVRQYFLPLAGTYEFTLNVIDETGFEACEKATVVVTVTPQEAISIEVIWDNPSDPDQNDQEGSDVDLHFVKMPNAWFSQPWDTYFANIEPNWGPELPSLDIDDTDGAGPETIQLDNPANDECYAIGVHYFRSFFDVAYPTVRIYIDGVRRAEFVGVLDDTDAYWDVARIHWPSRTIYPVDEYIENFNSDDRIVPAPTEAMIRNGHCSTF
jgi:hypothetical protein